MTCEHLKFSANVHVDRRVTDGSVSFSTDLKVDCADCGAQFVFDGGGTTKTLTITPPASTVGPLLASIIGDQ